MTVFWKHGKSTVREIVGLLPQTPAYTTILTTVLRLKEKGLLRKVGQRWKAVVFAPTCTEEEWQRLAAQVAVERFLSTPNVPRKVLISSLQEALGD